MLFMRKTVLCLLVVLTCSATGFAQRVLVIEAVADQVQVAEQAAEVVVAEEDVEQVPGSAKEAAAKEAADRNKNAAKEAAAQKETPVDPEDARAAQAAGEAVGEAVGVWFNNVAGGLFGGRRAQPARQANDQALRQSVDELDSVAELRKLKRELQRQPNVQNWARQLEQPLNFARDSELRTLHYVCDLKRSEFNAIHERTEIAKLKVEIKVYQSLVGAMRGRASTSSQQQTDPLFLLSAAMLEIAEQQLSEARFKAYEAEVRARETFRREAMVQSMTAAIDKQLLCSATQREELGNVFRENWQDSWLSCVQYLNGHGLRYFPDLPRAAMQSVLREQQKGIFQTLQWQPQNTRFLGINGMNRGVFGMAPQQALRLEDELEFAPETDTGERDTIDAEASK